MAINNLFAVIPQPNLATLATTVCAAHRSVMLAATNMIEHALTAGDALIAAKEKVGHGNWMSEVFIPNVAQVGDALALLRSLPDSCTPLTFFDSQHRAVLDKLGFGNEDARQRGRAGLPAMAETYIDSVVIEAARVLTLSGYLMYWLDTFRLVEGHHLRIPRELLWPVDLIAWDNLRPGMGKRSRRRGDYLLILQKLPIRAGPTWRDHSIPSRWIEKVDRTVHPHIKPIGLITRLIGAVTEPGDLVVDPAAGSFVVLRAARRLGRNFIGYDLMEAAA